MTESERETARAPERRRWVPQYRLKSLFVLTAIVAAYLGGRAARQSPTSPKLGPAWRATMPAGFVHNATLEPLGDDRYLLRGVGVLSGVYALADGRLDVVTPDDSRMTGLAWTWDGDHFVLSAETPNLPTGASYLGAMLIPRSDE